MATIPHRARTGGLRAWPRDRLRALRLLAIVLPLLFLVAVELLRRETFERGEHSLAGFLLTAGVVAAGVTGFSLAVFRYIGRLQQHDAEQSRQLLALNRLAIAATEKLNLRDVLATGLDHVLTASEADAGLVCLVDLEAQEHSAICSRGLSPDFERQLQRAKLADDPVAERAVRTRQLVEFRELFDDPRVREAAARAGISCGATVPLLSAGEVNGVIVVGYREPRPISEHQREFLRSIGRQLGLTIRNAALYEDSAHRNRDLSALLTVSSAVSSSLELGEVIERSLDTVISLASVDAAEIWLPEGEQLQLRCHRGASASAFLERTRFALGEGIPGLVAANREAIVTHDLSSDRRFLREAVVRAGFRTFGAFPLQYHGELVGVMTIAGFAPEALRDRAELRLLESIGEQIAPAIANAQLHGQIQDVAVLRERERISREMHDGLGQVLGYVNAQALAVRKLVGDRRLEDAEHELARLEEAARNVYADVREGILALRTEPGANGGAVEALRAYASSYRDMFSIEVDVQVSPDAEQLRLPAAAEIQLIRIVQEALSNVRRHAHARHVQARFGCLDGTLTVEIRDDGEGFDPARLPSARWPRFGLQTMRERAEAVGGTFALESAPGKGSRIVVQLPTTLK